MVGPMGSTTTWNYTTGSMKLFSPKPSYTYNDIGLVPRNKSKQLSRNDVDPSEWFLNSYLKLPIILAPMETVVGVEMAKAIKVNALGGQCVLPRLTTLNATHELVKEVTKSIAAEDLIVSIPAKNGMEWFEFFGLRGVTNFCIDVANGFSSLVEETVKEIRKLDEVCDLVTGNVASLEGYKFLSDLGVDAVRVGIGGGSVCTTSIATGIGVGQASIVREIAEYRDKVGTENTALLIADGGAKAPGDVAKAIALGADVVMMGGAFAGAEESPGPVLKIGDRKYKHLAGQASMYVKGQNQYVEGADKVVPYTGSVAKTWKAFDEGLRSAMTYMDCENLEELRYLPDEYFTYLSDAAKAERRVHA